MPGSQTLIHRGRKGSYETFEPGSTLDMRGNLIGATPFQEYHIDGTLGDDNNDGLAWGEDTAFKTIGKFMTVAAALGTRGRVRGNVAPGGYTEDIVTPLNTECPFGVLRGWNPGGHRGFGAVWLTSATATEPILTVKARGWRFEGFEYDAPASDGCILLDGLSANSNAAGVVIANSILVGQAQGDFGIDVRGNGAPYASFLGLHISGFTGPAMKVSESGTDVPRFWLVDDVTFVDNDDHILPGSSRGWKESVIQNSHFIEVGANRSATIMLSMLGGANNIVGPLNTLSGTYSIANGYVPSASDDWAGNINIAGMTTANPA